MKIQKVMMVDDEADIRLIGKMSLERVGHWETVMVSSGGEALSSAARERPDLILMDVMMPSMDGPSTLLELRKDPTLLKIPVIFLTAKVQKAEIRRYLMLGAAGVIRKPFDPMTLPDEIRSILKDVGE